jgi:hypothetical protein
MAFLRKDYSAYPQPVVVTPDPRVAGGSIAEAVAEAIDTQHNSNVQSGSQTRTASTNASASASVNATTVEHEAEPVLSKGHSSEPDEHHSELAQKMDAQHDSASQRTSARESQQQTDTARLADGIMSLLGPIVQEMDFNIVSVRKSQTELEKEIERLMAGEFEPGVKSARGAFN